MADITPLRLTLPSKGDKYHIMAKSLSELIRLFEDHQPQSTLEKASQEDPLVVELREAEELFDRRMEEEGDPYHIGLKVRIAGLKLKLAQSGKVVLNEQHRSLTRRQQPPPPPPQPSPATPQLEESISTDPEWDMPFRAEYEEVRDRSGKKVCDCPSEEIARWLANTLNDSLAGEYKGQLKARAETSMALDKYRNPEKGWFKPRNQ